MLIPEKNENNLDVTTERNSPHLSLIIYNKIHLLLLVKKLF